MKKPVRRFKIEKLVRDNIEIFFENSGALQVAKRALSPSEFDRCLRDKVIEEAHEVVEAKSSDELINECADVVEVFDALLTLNGKTWEDVMMARNHKIATRGAYTRQLFIETVDLPAGSEAANYYAADPDKYPEVLIK